jgi:hypothetical protein
MREDGICPQSIHRWIVCILRIACFVPASFFSFFSSLVPVGHRATTLSGNLPRDRPAATSICSLPMQAGMPWWPSGLYLYRLETADRYYSRTMLLVK